MAQNSTADINRTSVAELTYDSLEVDPAVIVQGRPQWRFAKVWSNSDGKVVASSFKSSPGAFRMLLEFDEALYLAEGRMTVTSENGTSVVVKAGDFVQLKRGKTYVFEIHEATTEFSVLVGQQPLQF